MTHPVRISVIVPTLNEEKLLEGMLRQFTPALRRRHGLEVIVSDGGSVDRTLEIAAECGAPVVSIARWWARMPRSDVCRPRKVEMLMPERFRDKHVSDRADYSLKPRVHTPRIPAPTVSARHPEGESALISAQHRTLPPCGRERKKAVPSQRQGARPP